MSLPVGTTAEEGAAGTGSGVGGDDAHAAATSSAAIAATRPAVRDARATDRAVVGGVCTVLIRPQTGRCRGASIPRIVAYGRRRCGGRAR